MTHATHPSTINYGGHPVRWSLGLLPSHGRGQRKAKDRSGIAKQSTERKSGDEDGLCYEMSDAQKKRIEEGDGEKKSKDGDS